MSINPLITTYLKMEHTGAKAGFRQEIVNLARQFAECDRRVLSALWPFKNLSSGQRGSGPCGTST
jgi:hypothetical protein